MTSSSPVVPTTDDDPQYVSEDDTVQNVVILPTTPTAGTSPSIPDVEHNNACEDKCCVEEDSDLQEKIVNFTATDICKVCTLFYYSIFCNSLTTSREGGRGHSHINACKSKKLIFSITHIPVL